MRYTALTGFRPFPRTPSVQAKAGSAGLPFFGIKPVVLDPTTGQEVKDTPGGEQQG